MHQIVNNGLRCLVLLGGIFLIPFMAVGAGMPAPVVFDHVIREAAVRVPVECDKGPSCGADISLEEARELYRELDFGPGNLLAMTDRHACDVFSNYDTYYWAPLDQFSEGTRILATLQNQAQSGTPFNGYMVVESDTGTETEQHLALCTVSQVGNAFGPPQQCATVAIITQKEIWLRARNRQQPECGRRQRQLPPSALGAVLIDLTVTGMGLLDVANEIKRVLLNELEFEATSEIKQQRGVINRVNIRAGAEYVPSKILQDGWSEIIDLSLTIEESDNGIRIAGEARPMVSRQAIRNKKDYKGTDRVQDEQYKKGFHAIFISALKAGCAKVQKIDANTIKCSK